MAKRGVFAAPAVRLLQRHPPACPLALRSPALALARKRGGTKLEGLRELPSRHLSSPTEAWKASEFRLAGAGRTATSEKLEAC